MWLLLLHCPTHALPGTGEYETKRWKGVIPLSCTASPSLPPPRPLQNPATQTGEGLVQNPARQREEKDLFKIQQDRDDDDDGDAARREVVSR